MPTMKADAEENSQYVDNFALFNAPPGTVQHMGVYFHASPDSVEGTRQAVPNKGLGPLQITCEPRNLTC